MPFGVKMSVNQDFKDLFKAFNAEGAKYLVVGAYAVTFHAEPRYTKDLDVWVEPTVENARKIWAALTAFGAPLVDVSVEDFADQDMVYQIGIEPNRIDILMGVTGLDFPSAWEKRVSSRYGDQPISVLSKEDLIVSKKAAGRQQDLLDVDNLQKKKPD